MILDTHLHLIDRGALRYPWLGEAPALERDWPLSLYRAEAEGLGITDALHMEVDVADADIARETEWVAGQGADGFLRGAIASGRPEEAGFAAYLEEIQDDPFVKGMRRVLHVVPDGVSQTPLFRENLRCLGAAHLPFDLCVLARQLPLALALVDAVPDTQFVLDHCGVPDVKAGAFEPWRRGISALAARPNVAAKVSGLPAYAGGDAWTPDTLRPYVEHVVAAFGWDRVVWGSDWPVCTLGGGLARWLSALREILSGASADETDRLFHRNAHRLWRLDGV